MMPAAAGRLLAREVDVLGSLLDSPARPFAAILGGAKVADKIAVIESLLGRCDKLLIGGAMAYTFLASRGESVGRSRVAAAEMVEVAGKLLNTAARHGVEVVLPLDHVVAPANDDGTAAGEVSAEIPADHVGLDIGPATLARFREVLTDGVRTVVWNGPLGKFEDPRFAAGTLGIARTLGELEGVHTVVGGGETAQAVRQAGVAERISHVSTGGGASLELLEGKALPGITALIGSGS
jgi:phosphoglycerate kinase